MSQVVRTFIFLFLSNTFDCYNFICNVGFIIVYYYFLQSSTRGGFPNDVEGVVRVWWACSVGGDIVVLLG